MTARRQPGDTSRLEETVLAVSYSLIGLAAATLIALRWFDRQVNKAVTFGSFTP